MKKEFKERKIINFIYTIFWVFIIGSVFGFFAEMLYTFVFTRTIEVRQGLLYGPFIQIYGIGAIAYYLLVSKIQDPKRLFFIGMFMGGSLEYLCSFFQEMFFGTISWDYSHLFMNFNGRTSLLYCFYWGIIAVIFLKIVYPCLQKIKPYIYKKGIRIFTIFFILFMTFDITISCLAANRQQERHNLIAPQDNLDIFLDTYYPDEFMDKVYHNKREISTVRRTFLVS